MGAFDLEILRMQQEAINSLNKMDEELEINKPVSDPNEGKSMADILREKREATDKILENTKMN